MCSFKFYISLIYFVWIVFALVGENSGLVIIWNLAPIRDETIEKDEKIPKRLCQMDNHLGTAVYTEHHLNFLHFPYYKLEWIWYLCIKIVLKNSTSIFCLKLIPH